MRWLIELVYGLWEWRLTRWLIIAVVGLTLFVLLPISGYAAMTDNSVFERALAFFSPGQSQNVTITAQWDWEAPCGCPVEFTAEANYEEGYVGLSWTPGAGNETTGDVYMRALYSADNYPESVSDGFLVFEGNDTSYSHYIPLLEAVGVHYSLFGVCEEGNETAYTDEYITAEAGGEGMTDLALLATFLTYFSLPGLLAVIAFWKRNVGVAIASIVALASVAPFVADEIGNWVLAPIVILIITLVFMILRDAAERRVEV